MVDFAAPVTPRRRLLLATLLPTLATAVAVSPELFSPSDVVPPIVLWLLGLGAPVVALVVNWRWPAATDKDRATWAALPQVLMVPLMVWLDVWIEIEQGYLRRDSSETAMALGIGTFVGVLAGIVLLVLVGIAGRLGAWLGER